MSHLTHVVALFVGFTGGLVVYYFLQGNPLTQQIVSFALGGFSFGSVVEVLAFIKEWHKEGKIPKLEFDGIFANDEPAYFIRVRKVKGEGMAESCEGFITVEGTDVNYSATVWSHDSVRRYDIGGHMDLRLFHIGVEQEVGGEERTKPILIFPSAHLERGFALAPRRYDDFIDRRIMIELYAKRGRVPKPYVKTIREIIRDASREGVSATMVDPFAFGGEKGGS